MMEIECNPNPSGLCFCGCGEKTTIAEYDQDPWAVKGKPRMYVVGHVHANGGLKYHEYGYKMIRRPEHPDAGCDGYIREHRLVAERALGRRLPKGSVVHHVDGDVTNNEPSNLVVCEDNAYHKLLHRRQRAYDATGDASAIRCAFCGEHGGEMYVYPDGEKGYHPKCRAQNRTKRGKRIVRNLTCVACGDTWERVRQDGRTPVKCPDCAPWRRTA